MAVPIRQMMLPKTLYSVKSPYEMKPEYITIHNTANRASANNEANYVITGTGEVSYHFAVDDIEAVQILPLDRNGWHAGDTRTGTGNRKSIGIEICYSLDAGDKRYPIAEDNAVWLTAYLLNQLGLTIDKVKKHQDWSGKYCPHRMLDNNGWKPFLAKVETELKAMQTSTKTLYRVQVGAFHVKKNAEAYRDKVKAAGFPAIIVEVEQ